MSTMRNSVMLIGRPGAEPEIKTFNNNKKADSKRQQTTTVDYKRLINGLVLTSVVTLQRQTNQGATRQIKLIH